jgi:hypothetical protein
MTPIFFFFFQVLPVKVVIVFLAGCTEALFKRVQTLMQDPKYYKLFKTTAFRQLDLKHGIREYYLGILNNL